MSMLWLDFESFSETPIAVGGYRYGVDARPLLFGFALDDAPAICVEANQIASALHDATGGNLSTIKTAIAHNAQFDRMFMDYIPLERWRCTMIQAMSHSLPPALADLCALFKLPVDTAKAKDGKSLVRLFCMPQKRLKKSTPALADTIIFDKHSHPEEWTRFKEYCRLDVEAMRAVARKLPTWNYSVWA